MIPKSVLLLYLASASPRRSQLLTQAGIPFEQYVVPVDEDALTAAYRGPLGLLGEYLARRKAEAAYTAVRAEGRPLGYVLASDTTVLLDGRSLPKPCDLAEAKAMLETLRDREHTVATGVALIDPFASKAGDTQDKGYRMRSATSETRVRMRAYTDEEIAAYVATGDPLDKAGAYSIQHPNFQPVQSFRGCHLGVIGLPVCLVYTLLEQVGAVRSLRIMREPPLETGAVCPWSAACTPPLPTMGAIHTPFIQRNSKRKIYE